MDQFRDYLEEEIEFSHYNSLKEIAGLRKELDYYKKLYKEAQRKYAELLDQSINHSRDMTGIMLKAALNGAFTPKDIKK